jgi:flagellar biosynthesis anti-sigma factor FlgM
MNIRSGIENLPQIQPSPTVALAKAQTNTPTLASESAISSAKADEASLSSAGTQVARSASTARISDAADVRLDKIAAIQAQLQAGTYSVPASAVAQRIIGALLVPKE